MLGLACFPLSKLLDGKNRVILLPLEQPNNTTIPMANCFEADAILGMNVTNINVWQTRMQGAA